MRSLSPRFRKEVLDPDDTFDKRLRMFIKTKERGFLSHQERAILEATPTEEPDKSTIVEEVDRDD
jgi:hypothetical protein